MKEITALMEVYNEESRVSNVLESMRNFDQVIIIDKSSTDRTAEIAKEYGATVLTVDYYDGVFGKEILEKVFALCRNDWIMLATCSDVIHANLYKEMCKFVNSKNEYEAIRIPRYLYSMGFMSKYSYYGGLSYQILLVNKSSYDFSSKNIHRPLGEYRNVGILELDDKTIAVYHLAHESLELILERHLRYAKVEAQTDCKEGTREEYLNKSWRSVLRMLYYYFKNRTWKMKQAGRAQLCMLLLYRCAHFLNLYMNKDEEENIAEIYNNIRNYCMIEEGNKRHE